MLKVEGSNTEWRLHPSYNQPLYYAYNLYKEHVYKH